MSENFIAVGNGELDGNPAVGKTFMCPRCHVPHDVEYGDEVMNDGTKIPSKLLAFYECNGSTYLCGLNGKELSF